MHKERSLTPARVKTAINPRADIDDTRSSIRFSYRFHRLSSSLHLSIASFRQSIPHPPPFHPSSIHLVLSGVLSFHSPVELSIHPIYNTLPIFFSFIHPFIHPPIHPFIQPSHLFIRALFTPPSAYLISRLSSLPTYLLSYKPIHAYPSNLSTLQLIRPADTDPLFRPSTFLHYAQSAHSPIHLSTFVPIHPS